MPTAGIDISTSGIKIAVLAERLHGLELRSFGEERLALGTIKDGEITDHQTVVKSIHDLAARHRVRSANIALAESRSYLFEADAPGRDARELRTAIEQHLDEYVPPSAGRGGVRHRAPR